MTLSDTNVIGFTPRKPTPVGRPEAKEDLTSAALYRFSERQQADKYQQWLAMIVESSSDAVIGKSLEGIILSWNEAAERLFGYSAENVIGQPVSMLFPEDEADDMQALITRCAGGEHIDSHQAECVRADGQPIWVSLALSPIKNKAGTIVGVATIARDITERKHADDRLHRLAFHDPLTGLPNRFFFRERVSQALAQARRHGHQVALLFIDLDRFKDINDSLGHQIGDRLLQITANRLRRSLREGDTVARLGGDEFVVCLSVLTDSSDALSIAAQIDGTLREPFRIGSHKLNVSGSIGISIYPDDGDDMDALMQVADSAMYHSKKHGRTEAFVPQVAQYNKTLLVAPPAALHGNPRVN